MHLLIVPKALFQCLHSQCPTAQFAPALHVVLSECSVYNTGNLVALPHLLRRQDLRERDEYYSSYVSGSSTGHASASAVHPILRRTASISASPFSRPTRTISYNTTGAIMTSPLQPTASTVGTIIPSGLTQVQNHTFVAVSRFHPAKNGGVLPRN